jgi:opacity protein-like surface antigen
MKLRITSAMTFRRVSAGLMVLLLTVSAAAQAVELKQNTIDAFNRYVRISEARMQSELRANQRFLWVDGLGSTEHAAALQRFRNGEVVIDQVQVLDDGKKIEVPDGMIHNWIGTVFIPGATLKQTLAFLQNYDRHQDFYKPDVVRSKLISHQGNDFKIFYRLKKKKVITVVMNTDYDVQYFPISPTREWSRSYSTRIAQVENPGQKDEHEKPVGNDSGFMWRLYSYWRFEQKDGGTYVQCEAISLTRDIPTGLGWLVSGFVQSIPRESLQFTLARTREGLMSILPKQQAQR